jgi:hypothetical protein
MSRLQVGDILIEGTKVSIGGTQPPPPLKAPVPEQPKREDGALLLNRIPFAPRVLGVAGAASAVVGMAINAWFSAWSDPFGALLNGGFLAPVGFGLVALGAAKHFAGRPAVRHRAALGGDPEPYIARLAPLLALPRPRQTIEWIGRQTGWPEETVVHALALLRERGQVQEELDLDTGEFYYVHTPLPSPGPRDLDTRLGDINT